MRVVIAWIFFHYAPYAIHVSAEVVGNQNHQSVLLLQTIDNFLSIKNMLASSSVGRGVVIVGRGFGVKTANVSNQLEGLQHPHVVADLFDTPIQPLRLLRIAILGTRIIQNLDMGVHCLINYFVGHVR